MASQEHLVRQRQVEQQGGRQTKVTVAHGLEIRPGKNTRLYKIVFGQTSLLNASTRLSQLMFLLRIWKEAPSALNVATREHVHSVNAHTDASASALECGTNNEAC